MKLLRTTDDYTVEYEPEILSLVDFAELVESRSKNPDILIKELGYIYFLYDMSSNFQFQPNEILREEEVKRYVGLDPEYKPDKYMLAAIKTFTFLSENANSKLLQIAYVAFDKLKTQLSTIDINERDKSGKPIWNIKQFSDTIKTLPDLMDSLDLAERKFIRAQEEKNKKSKDKSLYDGVNLGKMNK